MKKIEKITKNQIEKKGVQALADRPNALRQYGVGGLSAQQLKIWFDNLATFLADKHNAVSDALSGDEAAQYIRLALDDYGVDDLQALIDAMLDGSFATNILKVYPSVSALEAVELQAFINSAAKDISDIWETVRKFPGAYVGNEPPVGESHPIWLNPGASADDVLISDKAYILNIWSTNLNRYVGIPAITGVAPTIGENGHWFIGDDDSGVTATGDNGADGLSIFYSSENAEQDTTSIPLNTIILPDSIDIKVGDLVIANSTYSYLYRVTALNHETVTVTYILSLRGAPGYTPVKGTDYFTDEDISEVAGKAAEFVSVPPLYRHDISYNSYNSAFDRYETTYLTIFNDQPEAMGKNELFNYLMDNGYNSSNKSLFCVSTGSDGGSPTYSLHAEVSTGGYGNVIYAYYYTQVSNINSFRDSVLKIL